LVNALTFFLSCQSATFALPLSQVAEYFDFVGVALLGVLLRLWYRSKMEAFLGANDNIQMILFVLFDALLNPTAVRRKGNNACDCLALTTYDVPPDRHKVRPG
jgi:hypothetical protein